MGMFRYLAGKIEDSIESYRMRRQIKRLLQGLGNENDEEIVMAAKALDRIGEPAVPLLIETLGSRDWEARWWSAGALGAIGDASAVPALIEALGDEHWLVKKTAVVALGKIRDAAAVPALIEAFGDEDGDVRWKAVEELGWIGDASAVPALVNVLGDGTNDEKSNAAEALVRIGEPAVSDLVKILGNDGGDMTWRLAVGTLVRIGKPAVPALVSALGDGNLNVRRVVAEVLRRIIKKAGDSRELHGLEELLKEGCDMIPKRGRKIDAMMEAAKLLRMISERKNELSVGKDILLDDKPKPPKGGKIFRSMRRPVHV